MSGKRKGPAAGAPEALSGEFDAMRIVHEAVENGVGVGGIPYTRSEYTRTKSCPPPVTIYTSCILLLGRRSEPPASVRYVNSV
jgi:hypothetical protein